MIDLLTTGRITLLGRHPAASNAVFLVDVESPAGSARALYKPVAGERPLWDFPEGMLARREVAAFRFASRLGLDVIPPTVWRDDAPHGPGSLQQWIEDAQAHDVEVLPAPADGWLPVLDAELHDGTPVLVAHRDTPELRTLAALDAVMNNADRKAGHVLRDHQQALWAIDHGVTFHTDPKLRTVLWGFAGQPLGDTALSMLAAVHGALDGLNDWLRDDELEAAQTRADALLEHGVFPPPSEDWPAIPWPIY